MPNEKQRPWIFIAGPLGDSKPLSVQRENVSNALMYANKVWNMGGLPIVPHLFWYWNQETPKPREDWLEMCRYLVSRCNVVLRIPGESPGADGEVELAHKYGIRVLYNLTDLHELIQEWP